MTNFKEIVEKNRELIINRLVDLVKIPSVLDESDKTEEHPFGRNVRKALDHMVNLAKEDGFLVHQDGGYSADICYGNPNGKTIGVLAHLDVVPEGTGWTYPPYSATIVDGKMFGRGTTDDKGPLMASYMALKFIKDAGIKLKNQIKIILGTDEETAWRGVNHYFEHFPMPDLGFSPDCNFPVVYGEKGIMNIDLSTDYEDDFLVQVTGGTVYNVVLSECKAVVKKDVTKEFKEYLASNNLEGSCKEEAGLYTLIVKGKGAHAMEPFKGINAGTHMCNFLKDYTLNPLVQYVAKYHHLDHFCKNLGLDYDDYEMGPITCNLGIVNIGKNSRVTLDLRYPVRYDVKHFNEVLRKILADIKIEITKYSDKEPHYVSPDDPLVKLLHEAYVKNTGDTVNKPFTVGGGTYAKCLKKGVAFGMVMPYEEELCHQTDEYLNIETLITGTLIYIDSYLLLGEIDA